MKRKERIWIRRCNERLTKTESNLLWRSFQKKEEFDLLAVILDLKESTVNTW